ncbi:MAG: PilZ domain-containing protein, partial [Spirochaetes bacterium]|nr:PilZ domain-containing protein [Spirochaetota bacterium]
MEERRRSKRVPVDNIVMYQAQNYPDINLNENSKVDTPVSVNIGSGGLQIETNQHLAEGTYLQIVFSIPETNIAVQLNGKVIWVQDNKKKNYFQ